ncbi:MAG: 3-hydroxyacyl-ACP dehydratase FabZ [Christensenellales bacterium]|jgi:3-hydroxyacyl-[acyl-carrier-protein] dehydratase
MMLTKEQIQEIIPHRDPFLLVDAVVDYEPGKWARGIKYVSPDEPYFAGHFPNYPVMPGVLIIEALAQVGGVVVLSLPENRGKLALFGGIREARFLRQVRPGDTLELECEIGRVRGTVGFGSATAKVGGMPVCHAKFTFAIVNRTDAHP